MDNKLRHHADVPKDKILPETAIQVPDVKHWHVLCYYANIVDYLRYFLAIKGMHYAFVDELSMTFIFYYFCAIFLDTVDGKVARVFNQNSRLGCCLDMVCDRA
jgi:phosphatidylglycerophosphate synthase